MKFTATMLFLLVSAAPIQAEDFSTVSGRLTASAPLAREAGSSREDPSLTGRLAVEAGYSAWRFNSVLEGGWDGAVRRPSRDHGLVKSLDRVYQDNAAFLEVKEFYAERTLASVDTKVGIQRFAWGRLDEFPVNDLFNPWDYRHFLVKTLEERKIGVPAVSLALYRTDWAGQLVWTPWLVPYRLPEPDERWSLTPAAAFFPGVSGDSIQPQEPDLPAKNFGNGSLGLRLQRPGEVEWAVDLFHGFDPRPVFRTTALRISPTGAGYEINPGFVPSFHKITTIGVDSALVAGEWSLRGEAAYTHNRTFNTHPELWGYPVYLAPGAFTLAPIEVSRDTLDYGIGADYRPFEDGLLTLQAQQTLILDRPATLYERSMETILWVNLKIGWLNQKVETSLNLAYNPEHGASMTRPSATYILNDGWKAGLNGLILSGPPQSIFGRYAKNDQIGLEVVYSW